MLGRLEIFTRRAVVGLDGECKAKVVERVLVTTVNARLTGEIAQGREGVLHLGRGPFKEPAAASAEKGVAAEERSMPKICDVSAGVAWNIQDREFEAEFGQGDPIA